MKRKMVVTMLAISLVCFTTACTKEVTQSDESVQTTETVESEAENSNQVEEKEDISANQGMDFAQLAGREFYFSSGVGGWATTFTVNADGSFQGEYHDSEMGATGEGYPNGMMYQCLFKGQFGALEKVDEFTYKTTLANMEYEKEVGTEEIIDEIKYVYAEAYGFDEPGEFLFYLPGAKVADLPAEYRDWVRYEITDYTTQVQEEELPFYGFYNVNAQEGFSSSDVVEKFEMIYESTTESIKEIEKSFDNDPLSQVEYNEKANQMYSMWDYLLNQLWSVLGQTLSEDEMEGLKQEQRQWIAEKEEKVAKAGAGVEGGSMQPMVEDLEAARITKQRVLELKKKLE